MLRFRLRSLLHRKAAEQELDAELQFHLHKQIEENFGDGLSLKEARSSAMRQLGDLVRRKDECRDARRVNVIEDFLHDLRYSARMVRKSPAFTAIAVLTLALGIGANTAVFSVTDAVLLRMLPVPDPKQLVLLADGSDGKPNFSFETWQFLTLKHCNALSGLGAFRPWPGFRLSFGGQSDLIRGQLVSGNYFDVLGVHPFLGRLLTLDDDRLPGGNAVAVISHRYWHSRFGGDPMIVGQTVDLLGHPFVIVGVAPPEFLGTEAGLPVDITVPLADQQAVLPGVPPIAVRGPRWLRLLGRLRSGVALEQAQAELTARWTRMFLGASESERQYAGKLMVTSGAQGLNDLRRRFLVPLQALTALGVFVLVIACANLAALLLARAASRRQEIEVRRALGASSRRILRQLLTESVFLSCAGGALGIAMSYALSGALSSMLSIGTDIGSQPELSTLGFALAISVATGLGFGILPAWCAAGGILQRDCSRMPSRILHGESRWRKGLMAGQVGLCILLLTVCGLFAQSLANLRSIDSGFHLDHVLLASIRPAVSGYEGARAKRLFSEIYLRLAALPGVRSATLAMDTPLGGVSWAAGISVPGRAPAKSEQVYFNHVGPRFFETFGIRLIAGRDFNQQDDANASRVAVISESLARSYFPNSNPLGARIGTGEADVEIVGVAADTKYVDLREKARQMIYIPYLQANCCDEMWYAFRTSRKPLGLLPAVKREMKAVASNVPLYAVNTLASLEDETIAKERLLAAVSVSFGILVVSIAAIGLYGVLAYLTTRRTKEIALRIALGARSRGVTALMLQESLSSVAIGAAVGVPASLAASRFCQNLLYGLKAHDPATLAIAVGVMSVVGVLASALPALRAARIDPLAALREE